MVKKYGQFTHAILATDVVAFTIMEEALHVLLIKTNKPDFNGKWATPGGLVASDEGLEAAAFRHLHAKTGVKDMYMEQLATFGDPKRDPFGRVVSVAYMGLVPFDQHELFTTAEYDDIAWFPIRNLPQLAYDHEEVIAAALDRLKGKLTYTNIVQSLLPKQFTLTEMQNIYERILGKEIDKRNFRKKILSLGIVAETSFVQAGTAHRPAQLYRFTSTKPKVVQML
jgi:8-oxo-dGTP diphosphatase